MTEYVTVRITASTHQTLIGIRSGILERGTASLPMYMQEMISAKTTFDDVLNMLAASYERSLEAWDGRPKPKRKRSR